MILDKIIKPKWQHRDAEVRKNAIEEIDDPNILSELAKNDESSVVRRVAIHKISDLTILEHIARNDNDSGVREVAHQRFKHLLDGSKSQHISLSTRLTWINRVTVIDLLEHLALQGQEFEVRLAAIEKVDRQTLLGDIAISDTINKVRLAAVEKITDPETLERVHKTTRSRDKRVGRIAKDKLDALRAASVRLQEIRTEANTICTKLESLIHQTTKAWPQKQAESKSLNERWQTIVTEVSPEEQQRFTQAYQKFTSTLATHQASQQQSEELLTYKQDVCDKVDALILSLQEKQRLDAVQLQTFEQTLAQYQTEWAAIPSLEEKITEQQWQNRFNNSCKTLKKQCETLREQDQLVENLEAICQMVAALANDRRLVRKKQVHELIKRWSTALQASALPAWAIHLESRFERLQTDLHTRMEQQKQQRKEALGEIKQVLITLEQALEKGELKTAIPLEQQARQLQKLIGELSNNRHRSIEDRLHAVSIRIKELREWRSWGDDRERENLCLQIEALVKQQDMHPEEIANTIQEAREAWKKLGSPTQAQALWERFNSACKTAYEPCQVYFKQKGQEREENLLKKQQLCEQLEIFAQTIDWEQSDWKKIYHTLHDIENEWYKVGPVNRKPGKEIKQRYEVAKVPIDENLQAEQQRNQQAREQLIAEVEALAIQENINEAIEKTKQLQQNWHVTVPGNRKDERKLWRKFRKACDSIFERRTQERKDRDKQRKDNLKEKSTLCEELEALAVSEDETLLKTLPQLLSEKRKAWRQTGEVTKRSVDKVQKRFTDACKKAEQRYHIFKGEQQGRVLAVLHQSAALCATLETFGSDASEKIDEIKAQWDSLPALDNESWTTAIQQRFDKACAEAAVGECHFTSEMLNKKENLCIRLEILAEVDSPPEAHNARMAFQVERLSSTMRGGKQLELDKLTEVCQIETEWAFTHAVEQSQEESLQARFTRARDAFYQTKAW